MTAELFSQNSLRILRPSTLELLSQQLNTRMNIHSEDGRLRDYRGLGEVIGLSPAQLQKVERAPDHFGQILQLWLNDPAVTITTLAEALIHLDRHDVLEDARPLLLQDCEAAQNFGLDLASQTVRLDRRVLTLDDLQAVRRNDPLPKYDAMVMFSRSDENFGWHLIQRMETVGLRVFVPSRDVIAGTIEHSASERIIAERCKRVVIVFTPSLLASEEAEFLIDLAQYVSIQRRQAMLVPVMYKRCDDLPQHIQMLAKIKYDPQGYINFYQRLLKNVFSVAEVPENMLEYPDQFKNVFDDGVVAAVANAPVPAAAIGGAFSEFSNLSTMSSIRTEDLNTVSTTYSTVDSQAGLLRRMPEVPSEEPTRAGGGKSSKKSPIKKLKNLMRPGKKSKDYEPA